MIFPRYIITHHSSDRCDVVFKHGLIFRSKVALGEKVSFEEAWRLVSEHHKKYIPDKVKNVTYDYSEAQQLS